VSAKVNHGLNWLASKNSLLLNRPLPIGGWFCSNELYYALSTEGCGWGWEEVHDREYGGAALVAPLAILYWEKDGV
jgi:hypothetical protein